MKKATASSLLVAEMLFAVAVLAQSQQSTKIARIGYLMGATPEGQAARIEAFRQGLRDLGMSRGKTLSLNIDMQS